MSDGFKGARWFTLRDGGTLIALHDGFFAAKAEMLRDLAGEPETQALRAAEGDPSIDVNAYALRRDGKLILIDAGTGGFYGPALGHAARSLVGLGVRPESIETVLLTHPHGDHALGLLEDDGSLRYPKAEVFCPGLDVDFFQDERERDARGEAAAPSFDVARRVFSAVGNRLRPFPAGEILPGVEAISLPGHTMGHTGFLIDGEVLIWGDVIHLAHRQAERPSVCTVFDLDPSLAMQSRRAALTMASERQLRVFGMHTPFGQSGRVTRRGDAFEAVFARA